ncbi:Octopine transport system permease protein OccM [Hartmannibacter diazotrophicus]|uniref:Octopine transport system permease protein OccM n=1 Tax=Hartmannibacter diazotrophicus TaxID=1482074 RepID=A0A2C9D0Q4_9HYPH|nr:amino acid ABC transporter permease [Hartmannibacter diazotrophicus]SON53748.1 Octopine transport system permease protein OccM [Hartmannibacter diazotrophicus]
MSWKLFWLLVEAARLTVLYSAISISIGFVISAAICSAVMSSNRSLSLIGRLYISFFRGTPLLVQLLLIYYLLPSIGLDVPSDVAAIAGMAFCTSSYQAEILRGGFAGVPKGMVEAADICGFSRYDTFRRIRLPIAVKLTMPALISEAIMMLKSSSLVSVVGVIELTRMAQNLAASTYKPLQIYTAAGAIYLAINIVVAIFGSRLEKRMSWGRL